MCGYTTRTYTHTHRHTYTHTHINTDRHTNNSLTRKSFIYIYIYLSPSDISFPPFPFPLHLFLMTYWKKLACGVIWSFSFYRQSCSTPSPPATPSPALTSQRGNKRSNTVPFILWETMVEHGCFQPFFVPLFGLAKISAYPEMETQQSVLLGTKHPFEQRPKFERRALNQTPSEESSSRGPTSNFFHGNVWSQRCVIAKCTIIPIAAKAAFTK